MSACLNYFEVLTDWRVQYINYRMSKYPRIVVFVLALVILMFGCGEPSYENTYQNTFFSFEYPSILEVRESGDTDIVIAEIGDIDPMMRFEMLKVQGLRRGNTEFLRENFSREAKRMLDSEMKIKHVGGVKALYVKMVSSGSMTNSGPVELLAYNIPLDGKLLKIELTPQIPEDIKLGHDIVRTIKLNENN